jgi:hypothetical protein
MMKISCCAGVLLVTLSFAFGGQQPVIHARQAAGISFLIGERGAHHRIVSKVESITNELGQVTTTTNQAYIELGTGMHYRDKNGHWMETLAQIDLQPDGGAAATHGPHQIYFPADIYNGMIRITTPDGIRLQNRPLGISYFNGSRSVLISELTHSVGQLLPSGNQIIYTNAFTGLKADLVFDYRKDGVEANLIFRDLPPDPKEFGLDPQGTRVQLLTEFFDTPEPLQTLEAKRRSDGLRDTVLDFGSMRMMRGKAFPVSQTSDPGTVTSVFKTWTHVDGRTILIEELPYAKLKLGLQKVLPPNDLVLHRTSPRVEKRTASSKRRLPPARTMDADLGAIKLAKADLNNEEGFVVDYQLLLAATDFTFRGDVTYYVSNSIYFSGTTTIEGGTVVKFAPNTTIYCGGNIVCNTGPYRPAVFTAKDDNSVGETVPGSTGIPSGYYGIEGIGIGTGSVSLKGMRMAYMSAAFGISDGDNEFSDIQVVNCGAAFQGGDGSAITVRNGLFSKIENLIHNVYQWRFSGTQLTVDNCTDLAVTVDDSDSETHVYLTNSLLTAVVSLGNSPHLVYTTDSVCWWTTDPGIFQTVGAGNYYLATNSQYRNVGTINLEPALLANLARKTTYPPSFYSNVTVCVNTTFDPRAKRDTDVPDLGYHYDPLDYIVCGYILTNATLKLTPGTALACCNDSGVVVEDGSSIISLGTPSTPNWLTRYQSVQEQPISLGPYGPSSGFVVNPYHYGANGGIGTFRFSKFTCPAGGGYHIYHYANWSFSSLSLQDCEIWGGQNFLGGSTGTVATVKSTLFDRATFSAINNGDSTNVTLTVSNSLFWRSSLVRVSPMANSNSWSLFNNSFDTCTMAGLQGYCNNDYNGYIICNRQLTPTNSHNVVLTSFNYAAGLLGDFYQASTNFLNAGSVTADLAGLYHYTTLVDQSKEAGSVVDIGLHYVALNNLNNPIDTDSDAIADYLEDANGNGADDSSSDPGNWMVSDTDGDGIPDGLELQRGTSARDPNSGVLSWFANASQGSDLNNGRAAVWNGTDGPFATINKAISNAIDGDIVNIAQGTYPESVDLCGRDVDVRINGQVILH